MATDERTSTDVENSATEISTDSEFEHDGATPTRSEIPPDILIAHRRRRITDEPKRVQVSWNFWTFRWFLEKEFLKKNKGKVGENKGKKNLEKEENRRMKGKKD